MRKKLKALFWGCSILIMCGLYMMPKMVQSSIPSIYYVTPNRKTYENVVNCTGTVQAVEIRTVYLDSPVVAKEIHVQIGERVATGDVLVSVDTERTSQLRYSSWDILKSISQETIGEQATSTTDWETLAAAYGLSATVLSAGAEQYSGQLKGLLGDMGIVPDAVGVYASSVNGSLKAPADGIITDISIQAGVPAAAGAAVVTITDDSAYKVMAAVSESDISKIVVGDAAVIRGVGFGGSVYTGTVTKVYPSARKTLNGTTAETVVDVEIMLDRADNNLKPGFTAKVEIIGGEDYRLLTVPYEAIRQDENNDEYVYVYEDGKIKKVLITTGKELTNEVQVLSGLTEESIVVFNPGNITREGAMIHLKGRAYVD